MEILKKILFVLCLMMVSSVHSFAQVNCADYKIVSIYNIPPTPITPGGNYFLLLLTLQEDNVSNIDNYANLFFVDDLGDTISIPTGPSSTLPRFSSDTIPYILRLNSVNSNQDFPEEFSGKLVIVHATQLICHVNYSNISTDTINSHQKFGTIIYPSPFVDLLNVDSDRTMESIFIISSEGRIVYRIYPNSKYYEGKFDHLSVGKYHICIQFQDGGTECSGVMRVDR